MATPLTQLPAAPALTLDPRTYDRALACVHCGLCLPSCPTYTTTWHEADSPRGRIQLIKGLADGTVDLTDEVRTHLDLCLDCRACETACPSEVVYHELIEEARTKLPPNAQPFLSPRGALLRLFFFHILTRPTRLRLALLPARLLQKLGLLRLIQRLPLLPGPFQKLAAMLPESGNVWPQTPPEVSPATQPVRLRVAFFATCTAPVMFESVNRKAIELLARLGAEVHYPRTQGCCGAIHHHNSDEHTAADLARRNIDALESVTPDYIVTTVAGCGAQLREYALLLRDDPAYAPRAAAMVTKVRDITEVIAELGLPDELSSPFTAPEVIATYHDACHLIHAQRVSAIPKKLLARVPGLRMIRLPESEMCCGAAGTYNLTEPEMAQSLGQRKLSNIHTTGAQVCITGNAGCSLHISATSRAAPTRPPLKVLHPVEVLHAAVFRAKL